MLNVKDLITAKQHDSRYVDDRNKLVMVRLPNGTIIQAFAAAMEVLPTGEKCLVVDTREMV